MLKQKVKVIRQLGFNLNEEDAKKLRELQEFYQIPKAMTVRFAIRNEYDRVIGKSEAA